jgi:hypothetical protein
VKQQPVIAKGMPGTEHNKYGFEGGCVLKLDGVYHLFTSEMVAVPNGTGLSPFSSETGDGKPAEVR